MEWPSILLLRWRYARQLKRIRAKLGKEKIRVLFLVGNISKWKLQSLYDLMSRSSEFEPIVALTVMDIEFSSDESIREARISELREYFTRRGINWVDAYYSGGHWLPLSDFSPDIVFYTLSGRIADIQSPKQTSKFSLTCYVPYFVQNYGYLPMDCECKIHRYIWRHFTLNELWAKVFMEDQGARRAGKVIGTGHPMLDQFKGDKNNEDGKLVVYAPHFSCNVMECYSTFLQVGKKMLDLAKSHPEILWVFKPHPSLKHTLIHSCGWSEQEVEDYYGEWNRFSISCYDCDYVKLFEMSRALITDCASFLVEYACTKKPIIHLISDNAKVQAHPIAAGLFNTYYQAHNCDEFEDWFNSIILQGLDPRREVRSKKINEFRLCDSNAAYDIIKYLGAVLASMNSADE